MNFKNIKITILITGLSVMLASCVVKSPEVTDPPYTQAAAIKSQGGSYKVGNPYKILGKWYYPKEDYDYSEIGEASWYGPDFHSKVTANGEKYNMYSLTAAHRTLPIPSIVRITNLENGRSLVVRINDRGPYARDRIIDVSKKGAQLLGFLEQGTAKVKVEILEKESKNLKVAMTGRGVMEVAAAPTPVIVKGDIGEQLTPHSPKAQTVAEEVLLDRKTGLVEEVDITTTPARGFYVQVGAFSSLDAAKNLGARLSQFGDVKIVESDVNGRHFFRVRIGAYHYHQDALDTQSKVIDYGISATHIIEI